MLSLCCQCSWRGFGLYLSANDPKILHSSWCILHTTFRKKKMTGPVQVTELLHQSGTNSEWFFTETAGAFWPFSMSVRAIDPVYVQVTSPMRVTFPSGISFVVIIRPRCRINTQFCPELNREYVGQCFISLRYIVLRYRLAKYKEFVPRKFNISPLTTEPNIDLYMEPTTSRMTC